MLFKSNHANIVATERLMSAQVAFSAADILRLNYPGGYRIARGLDLMKRIVAEKRARPVVIATVDCESRDEAAAIQVRLNGAT